MRVEHEGVYVAVASLAGRARNPSWYLNLRAHPEADLQDGSVRYSMVAREAVGNERELWWARAVAAWPEYEEYQAMTNRVIPVMVLEPKTRGSAT
jgi:deazaflavin-dependent oxidoreductase (nitroreductase family)